MNSEMTAHCQVLLDRILQNVKLENSCFTFDWWFEKQYVNCEATDHASHPVNTYTSGWFVNIAFTRPDIITGVRGTGRGRKEFIPLGASESSVVKTCWLLLELLVRHELMESFSYQGKRIFNPHHTVRELASIQEAREQAP